MAAQHNDFIRLSFDTGDFKDIACQQAGLDWPPPERIMYGGIGFVRRELHRATAGRSAVFTVAEEGLQQALQEAMADCEDYPRTLH